MAKPQQRAFDRAVDWALMGTSEPLTVPSLEPYEAETTKTPA